MALREKLRERVGPYLRPDEQVQQVFTAQSGMWPWLNGLGALYVLLFAKMRIVVVTDQRILVLRAGKLTGSRPKDVIGEAPRTAALGPVKGLWGKIEVAGETMWVHKRFHKDVNAVAAGQ